METTKTYLLHDKFLYRCIDSKSYPKIYQKSENSWIQMKDEFQILEKNVRKKNFAELKQL